MRVLSYVVPAEDDGRLIRRVARGRLGISSHQLARAKALGALCLDGESVHADHAVRAGQVVSVTLIDEEEPAVPVRPENAPVSILYEDDDLYVIDKPAPLSTQSSPRQPDNTLENRLAWRYRDVPGFVFRPVNRLDRGTSGLMVAAKHAHSQMLLSRQLHTPEFAREYLAVTDGVPAEPEGVIDAPIGKADGATVRREVRADGKPSRTAYRTLEAGHGAHASDSRASFPHRLSGVRRFSVWNRAAGRTARALRAAFRLCALSASADGAGARIRISAAGRASELLPKAGS